MLLPLHLKIRGFTSVNSCFTQVHGMTASYTEISFNTQSSEPDDSVLEDVHESIQEGENINKDCKRLEDTVERPSNLQLSNDGPHKAISQNISTNRAIEFLNQLNGTVTQDGPMVSFVAEDLETKIKLSSPVSKSDGEYVVGYFFVDIGYLC